MSDRRTDAVPAGDPPYDAEYGRSASIVAAALDAARAALENRPRAAAGYALAWAFGTALLAARHLIPGPRTRADVASALATSLAIPFATVFNDA